MQLTPAQRHRARVLAAKAQAESPFGIEVQGSEYELMMAKLATDKRTLKNLESVQLSGAPSSTSPAAWCQMTPTRPST